MSFARVRPATQDSVDDAKDRTTEIHALDELVRSYCGSGTYLLNGHPDSQVTVLTQTLRQAAAEGVEWRKIYDFIYRTWCPRRPHFPHPDAMAVHVDIGRESMPKRKIRIPGKKNK